MTTVDQSPICRQAAAAAAASLVLVAPPQGWRSDHPVTFVHQRGVCHHPAAAEAAAAEAAAAAVPLVARCAGLTAVFGCLVFGRRCRVCRS